MEFNIDGIEAYSVKTIVDSRGKVIKYPEPPFHVEDVYVTTVFQYAIKGWHGYETKKLFWNILEGTVKLALYDNRKDSKTYQNSDTIYLSSDCKFSIYVPPGVFNGFQGLSEEAKILVMASEKYEDAKVIRHSVDHFDYDWSFKNG